MSCSTSRLFVSYLHLGVVCHDVSPPWNLPSVNIALILSFYGAFEKLKPEAGVLSSDQTYSAAAGGAPSLASPRPSKWWCMFINKKKFSLHRLCFYGIALNTTDYEGRKPSRYAIWSGCHGLSPSSNEMNRLQCFVAFIMCDDYTAVVCRPNRM